MKANFKPLGLVAAVAAASAGYTGVVNAQATVAGNGLGDMAIVPYYTTVGDFVTGVHIINTSAQTQVVKLRMRRATDSMDALDFNLIMSPQDEWTGFIAADDDGDINFNTSDTTCTAPITGGKFKMPGVYRTGADTGYIEVIGMGAPTSELMQIAVDAKHTAGVPKDCASVATNFFENAAGTGSGVVNSALSMQLMSATATAAATLVANTYVDASDSLKVSFFIRDNTAGVEFGSDATHFSGFLDAPSITNQEFGIFSEDLQGFDFPDLNGGAPYSLVSLLGLPAGSVALRGKYEDIRAAIGGSALINDWSANSNAAGFTVGTDWVVTVPGQYTMLDLATYIPAALAGTEAADCKGSALAAACDNRDIPLTATFTVYDREEAGIVLESGDLVVSPDIPGSIDDTTLDYEVNVIEWGVEPVLDAPQKISVSTPEGAVFGWANLAVVADSTKTQAVCDFDANGVALDPNADLIVCTDVVDDTAIPLVGFVAWERSFAANPDANYGRIIDHSRTVTSS